jgi:isopropylmalate/homocitrate/citramalate synthase
VKEALDQGIKPRCHFEDITRADFYGFVLPFAYELMELSKESGVPIKIRACDTMGYGVTYYGAALPRSVPGIIYGLNHYADVPSAQLEWHGHNDFYKVVSNAGAAWMYGCASINCSMLGIGERTGNCPLEAMAIEYASLRGSLDGMDTTVITEIAEYFEKELNYSIPPMTPFVGSAFNLTRAGIHADGIMKDTKIYNIFDTDKILNRPAEVAISNTSGTAGIAYWIDKHIGKIDGEKVTKQSPIVIKVKEEIDRLYEDGRTTLMGDDELEQIINFYYPRLRSTCAE